MDIAVASTHCVELAVSVDNTLAKSQKRDIVTTVDGFAKSSGRLGHM
jgi:hypothetical protein